MTRRLRTCMSPVRLYSDQRAIASSVETRRRLEAVFIFGRAPTKDGLTDEGCIGSSPDLLHHPFVVIAASASQPVSPGEHLGHGGPHLLGDVLAERQAGEG